MRIDWLDPMSRVTKHFTVREAAWLPSWGVLHQTSEIEQRNLLRTCEVMEKIRTLFGKPINVHCMIRPVAARCPGSQHDLKDYNAAIGSTAIHSPHIVGMACDFDVIGMDCDEARATLLPHLDDLGICMEDVPGGNWVHVDTYAPSRHGGHRFSKP